MKLSSRAASDPGRVRPHNEDRYHLDDAHRLYAVADGLGGLKAGEIASQIFVDTVRSAADRFTALAAKVEGQGTKGREELLRFLDELFQQASRAIYEHSEREPQARGMATTGVVLGLLDGLAVLAHVGDSRAYLVRKGQARQLTTDHTVFQRLLDAGLISPERAADFPYRNLLERSVGDLPRCQVDTCWMDVQPGDQFVLCSDGLTTYLDPPRLASLCQNDVKDAVDAANAAGGADNITVLSVKVGDDVRRFDMLDTDTRVRALNQLALFKDLTFQDILQTMKIIRERRCQAGEKVVAEGEPGDSMFVVVEGSLTVHKGSVQLASLAPGDHFGDLAFLDRMPRSASVVAQTQAVLLALGREDFLQIQREHPAVAAKLMTRFALNLALRLRALSEDYVVQRQR